MIAITVCALHTDEYGHTYTIPPTVLYCTVKWGDGEVCCTAAMSVPAKTKLNSSLKHRPTGHEKNYTKQKYYYYYYNKSLQRQRAVRMLI